MHVVVRLPLGVSEDWYLYEAYMLNNRISRSRSEYSIEIPLNPHKMFLQQRLRLATTLLFIGAIHCTGAFTFNDNSSTSLLPVNYGAFTQTATYSVANQLGFFTAYGLNVTYLQVPNSTYGYAQLVNGGYDILTGTIDNAVNLRFNQDESLTVTGQLDGGPELSIASIPSITSILKLKGKSLMVDSPVSGYAYILRKVLSLYGLYLENNDYTFQVRAYLRWTFVGLIS